jgi:LacI family transcriptional regulator
MSEKITLATIAEILNVSPITVSRALSGQPGVGEELRERIINKAKELGYNRIKCIDKKYDNVEILLLVKHHFFSDNSNFGLMVQGIEKYIKKYAAEFTVEFVENEKQESLEMPYNLSRNNRFSGVILLGRFSDEYISLLREKVSNLVIFNSNSYEVDCDFVYFNFNRTGYKAAKYLIEKGHRKIGFIGVEGLFNNPQRFLGFSKALERYGIEIVEDYLINKASDMEDKIQQLIDQHNLPTAIICQSDNTALKLIKLLYDNGLSVPGDVSVIGIGNTEMSSISIPALTTFDLNIDYAAETAVRLLMNRISDRDRPYRVTYIDTKLVERQSVRQLGNGHNEENKS